MVSFCSSVKSDLERSKLILVLSCTGMFMLEQQALGEPFLSTSSDKGYSSFMSTSNTVATTVSADINADSFIGFMIYFAGRAKHTICIESVP